MAFRALALAALRVAHDAAYIVNLKSQQMPDPMREKYTRDALLQSGLPGQLDHSDLKQEIAQKAMRGKVHLAVIASRHNFLTQAQLGRVQRLNEVGIEPAAGA